MKFCSRTTALRWGFAKTPPAWHPARLIENRTESAGRKNRTEAPDGVLIFNVHGGSATGPRLAFCSSGSSNHEGLIVAPRSLCWLSGVCPFQQIKRPFQPIWVASLRELTRRRASRYSTHAPPLAPSLLPAIGLLLVNFRAGLPIPRRRYLPSARPARWPLLPMLALLLATGSARGASAAVPSKILGWKSPAPCFHDLISKNIHVQS